MPPGGVSASRGLMRISTCPRASHSSRTVGMASPAPSSTATTRRPSARRSQLAYRASCSAYRARSHSQSPNIRMFGRAMAPQSGQAGNADRARIVASSTSTCTPSAGQMSRPHSWVHWR